MKRKLQELILDGNRRFTKTLDLPKIVCLCGSTRFYKEFQRVNYEMTALDGHIVLSVGFYPHAEQEVHGESLGVTKEQKRALDDLHLRKIDLADAIFVINVGGYVGESTLSEIAYAIWKNKPIRWLETPEVGTDDWIFANQYRLAPLIAKHAGVGHMYDLPKEKTITLNQDIEGLGKAGDIVSMDKVLDLGFQTGMKLGYAAKKEEG